MGFCWGWGLEGGGGGGDLRAGLEQKRSLNGRERRSGGALLNKCFSTSPLLLEAAEWLNASLIKGFGRKVLSGSHLLCKWEFRE